MECLQQWYIRKGLGTRNSKLQAPIPQKKKKQCTHFSSLVRATEKRPTSGVSGCTWYIYLETSGIVWWVDTCEGWVGLCSHDECCYNVKSCNL